MSNIGASSEVSEWYWDSLGGGYSKTMLILLNGFGVIFSCLNNMTGSYFTWRHMFPKRKKVPKC